jgi:hypothetical protein
VSSHRDVLEAAAYHRRRLVAAVVTGDPAHPALLEARPWRTLLLGVLLAGLLLAGGVVARVLT